MSSSDNGKRLDLASATTAQIDRGWSEAEEMPHPDDKAQALGDVWKPLKEWGPWLSDKPPTRTYLLSLERDGKTRPVLPLGKVGMFAGAGGAGKSWAMTQLALAVATGHNWLGFTVDSPGRVLLVLGEEEKDEAQRRLYRAAAAMNLTAAECDDAARRIWVVPMAGRPVALTKELDGQDGKDLPVTELFREFEKRMAAPGEPWRLIVLDPLSRFAGPDVEVDNAAATRFVQVLERLSQVEGTPTVLVTHHTNKGSRQPNRDKEGNPTDASAATGARGSSALTDGVRWQANLTAMPRLEGAPVLAELAVVKNNYGPPTGPLTLCSNDDDHGALRGATQEQLATYEAAAKKANSKAAKSGGEGTPPREVVRGND